MGVLVLLALGAAQAESGVFGTDGGVDCDRALDATKAVCGAYGVTSSSCVDANVAYRNHCDELGESVMDGTPNLKLLDEISKPKLKKMSKDKMMGLVEKLSMAYALSHRASTQMRVEMKDKIKACKAGQERDPNKLPPLKKDESEKAGNPKDETNEEKKEEKKEEKAIKDA